MTEEKLDWWGYLHTSGDVQAKRYHDERDIEEAKESPFCAIVVPPFKASGREEAIKTIVGVIRESLKITPAAHMRFIELYGDQMLEAKKVTEEMIGG